MMWPTPGFTGGGHCSATAGFCGPQAEAAAVAAAACTMVVSALVVDPRDGGNRDSWRADPAVAAQPVVTGRGSWHNRFV